ncbi:hypothetical protein ACH4TX_45425 [Streptomyces sp. NPDC021098]|uniref:hypothetical protein n=1 Tax=unclassified Streptomyces TaxID=2593676 RepID=UPI0037BB6A55
MLAVALLVGMALRIGGALNVQVGVSALLVFANPAPNAYALARLWETAAESAVTVVLAPLPLPPNPRAAFAVNLRQVSDELAEHLHVAGRLVLSAEVQQEKLEALRQACIVTEARARVLSGELRGALRGQGYAPRARGGPAAGRGHRMTCDKGRTADSTHTRPRPGTRALVDRNQAIFGGPR